MAQSESEKYFKHLNDEREAAEASRTRSEELHKETTLLETIVGSSDPERQKILDARDEEWKRLRDESR